MLKIFLLSVMMIASSLLQAQEFSVRPQVALADDSVCQKGLESFQKSIYPLITGRCSGCHGDEGKYLRFASSNPATSYQRMLAMQNFSDIAGSYFVKQGGAMVPDVNAENLTMKVREWWDNGEKQCQLSPPFETTSIKIPDLSSAKPNTGLLMRWPLDHLGEDFKGSQFELEVQRFGSADGPVKAYLLAKPRLLAVKRAIAVEKMAIALNGKYLTKTKNVFDDVATVVSPKVIPTAQQKTTHPVLTGRGVVVLVEQPGFDSLKIGFSKLAVAPLRTCHFIEKFRTDVVPILQERSCHECHGGGPSLYPGIAAAKTRLPMNLQDEDLCASFLERVQFAQPKNSPLLVLPDFGAGGHSQASVAAGELTASWMDWLKLETK